LDLSLLCGEHAVSGRGLDALLDACCRIELGSSDSTQSVRRAIRLAPETSWLVMLTGGQAGPGLAGAVRSMLAPDVQLLLVSADLGSPTTVSGSTSARLMSLRTLDELPRAIVAAAQGVPQ
jgi:hypothetical protein